MKYKVLCLMVLVSLCFLVVSCGNNEDAVAQTAVTVKLERAVTNTSALSIGQQEAFTASISPDEQKGSVDSVNFFSEKGIVCQQSEADKFVGFCTATITDYVGQKAVVKVEITGKDTQGRDFFAEASYPIDILASDDSSLPTTAISPQPLVSPDNLPLSVPPCPGGAVSGEPQEMPFYVFGDPDPAKDHFCPSGYMGDIGDIKLEQGDVILVTYTFDGNGPNSCGSTPCKWAGIYWMNREYKSNEQWAADPYMGYNLSNASRLVFRARSEQGAQVEFKVGGIGGGLNYPDSLFPLLTTGFVQLTAEWQEFTIPLNGANLSYVIGGFLWATDWSHNPGKEGISFELDDIRYEK